MADQWFYRMFGEEFGPMPMEKLKELADGGTIQALDQVRSTSSDEWVAAATVDELGLSTSERGNVAMMTATSLSDIEINTTQSGNDEWYCQLAGQELGPLSFDELLKYAEHEQLDANDQVKLGLNGKWRRVGSIGRLMAALPYKAVEKKIVPGAAKPRIERPFTETETVAAVAAPAPAPTPVAAAAADTEATYRVAYEQAKAKLTESMLAQADAAYKAAEEQAMSQVAWAKAANVDRYWWGWASGVEFGPVEFIQVFGLAKSGQLKPADFVRNGSHGQFVPSQNVPGLLKAIEVIARAEETRNLAKAQAQAAAAIALPPPVAPTALLKAAEQTIAAEQLAKSNPAMPAVQPAPQPARPRTSPSMDTVRPASDPHLTARTSAPVAVERTPEPEPEPQPVRPSTSYSSANSAAGSGMSGFSTSSSSMSTYGSNSSMSSYGSRPTVPPKPVYKKQPRESSPWLSDMMQSLKEPKALGAVAAVALVLMIVGWGYLPKSRAADIKKYQALKQIMDEIKSKRTSAPNELASLQQKLTKVGKDIATELKDKASRDEPAKQCLLWAARDEVPRVAQASLATVSPAETSLENRLKEAAYELGLEKRPPVDMAQLAARANED